MSKEIIERLRGCAEMAITYDQRRLLTESAEAIESLQAKVAELLKENERLKSGQSAPEPESKEGPRYWQPIIVIDGRSVE